MRFLKLWEHVRSRGTRRHLADVGRTRKLQRMMWCMSEALRARVRAFLRRSKTLALHLDKGQRRLLVRLTGVDSGCHRMSVVLGLKTMCGGHRELLSCTKEILEEACRPESGRPASCKEESTGVKRRLPRVNDTLVRKAIKRIHLWNADGAADGQLAGELNLRSSQLAENQKTFGCLKAVSWDLTHGSRRLTSRPWKADSYLAELLDVFLIKKTSLIRIMQNSQELQELYVRNCANMRSRIGAGVSNLSWAGHRFLPALIS